MIGDIDPKNSKEANPIVGLGKCQEAINMTYNKFLKENKYVFQVLQDHVERFSERIVSAFNNKAVDINSLTVEDKIFKYLQSKYFHS